MSTPQRTHACITLTVDRFTADVLRLEAKKILMFGHEPFEDFLDLNPESQCARRLDLGATVTDRLDDVGEDEPVPADVMAELTSTRRAAAALDYLIGAYTVAIAGQQS